MPSDPAYGRWYLPAEDYWVSPEATATYPYRQGDLFGPLAVGEEEWDAALLIHPTCELAKRSVRQVHVVRVRRLSAVTDRRQQSELTVGFTEKDGVTRVAWAHTFFLAPVPGDDEPLYANFREFATCPRERLLAANRCGTMTHEARVTLIRRKLYFRFRIMLSVADVQAMEARRIASDPNFAGPKPPWAEGNQ